MPQQQLVDGAVAQIGRAPQWHCGVGGKILANLSAFGMSFALPRARMPVTLQFAVDELLAQKAKSNRRPLYIRSLRQYLTQFIRGREQARIGTINETHVEEWFRGRTEKPATRASNVGRLSALFSHAFRRRWISENPCDRIERISIDVPVPKILRLDQCANLLWHCQRHKPVALAYLTLALHAGIRPIELSRISWESTDLTAGIVIVDAAASKVRRRRIVHLEPTAIEWLKKAKELRATLPASHSTRRRYVHAFRRYLNVKSWPQDVLRHTCASYWLASCRDAGRVAFELGNSPAILLRHYREIVRIEDANRFWQIKPL